MWSVDRWNHSTLVISGDGSLTAQGCGEAAGIGGSGSGSDVLNIIIESGTINATGSGNGAGIGSSGNGEAFELYIVGGVVNAVGNPGIGASNGAYDECGIEGGVITVNSFYSSSVPAYCIFSEDGGNTYTVYDKATLTGDLTIPEGGELKFADDSEIGMLTIPAGITLTNNGTITCSGSIINNGTITGAGAITGSGSIYNNGTVPSGAPNVKQGPYVEVIDVTGSGHYEAGAIVTIQPDSSAASEGNVFSRWEIINGTLSGVDLTSPALSFPCPDGCVIIRARYDLAAAQLTTPDGEIFTYASASIESGAAARDLARYGGTMKMLNFDGMWLTKAPVGSVLDLNEGAVRVFWVLPRKLPPALPIIPLNSAAS